MHAYGMPMIWNGGGGEGGLAQYFAKIEAGNSLCILAFLQETNVIFWDIKGLFVVSSVTENENINMDKITFFFLYKWHMFFNLYACPFKKQFIYKPYFFSWLVSSSCSLSCMIKIWILFLEITVTPFQRSGGIYVAAIFTAKKKKFTGKTYFVRKLYFLSELDVHLNVLYSVRGLKIWVFIKTSWTRK